jgi:hypothetical protein
MPAWQDAAICGTWAVVEELYGRGTTSYALDLEDPGSEALPPAVESFDISLEDD